MAELHTSVYFKHKDKEVNESIKDLIQSINDSPRPSFESVKSDVLEIAGKVFSSDGEVKASKFLSDFTEEYDLIAESRDRVEDYHVAYFVHGSSGEEVITKILEFLGSLSPGIDARACLAGDDDPWEIFYRWQDGKVKSEYFEPDEMEDEDEEEFPAVYLWWHEGLPETIKEGFLHEWAED